MNDTYELYVEGLRGLNEPMDTTEAETKTVGMPTLAVRARAYQNQLRVLLLSQFPTVLVGEILDFIESICFPMWVASVSPRFASYEFDPFRLSSTASLIRVAPVQGESEDDIYVSLKPGCGTLSLLGKLALFVHNKRLAPTVTADMAMDVQDDYERASRTFCTGPGKETIRALAVGRTMTIQLRATVYKATVNQLATEDDYVWWHMRDLSCVLQP